MKHLFFALTAAALALFLGTAVPSAQEVVGYWQFEEGSGKKIKDTSEIGNDGFLVGDCKWVEGKFGKGLQVGDSEAYVSVPDNQSLQVTDAITMAGWTNVTSGCIIGKGGDYFLRLAKGPAVNPGVQIGGWKEVTSKTILSVPQWSHVAATYDGETFTAYLNGKPDGSIALAGQIAVNSNGNFVDLILGNTGWGPFHSEWDSLKIIDEILVANYAFTDEEINELMKYGLKGSAVEPALKLSTTWSRIKVGSRSKRPKAGR
jgi:hypothetical protein